MATDYSARYQKTLGCSSKAMGGAAEGMGIDCLSGDTEMITVFDDFNGVLKGSEGFSEAAVFEDSGWVLTDAGVPVADEIHMNDPSNVDSYYGSQIVIYGGTDDDAGGSMQLDLINGSIGTMVGTHDFKHMWISETDAGVALNDNTVWTFAARIGCQSGSATALGATSGGWNSKCYIGYSAAGDVDILVATTGLPDVATQGGPIVGISVNEDGIIQGHAQRTADTALAAGTNFTNLTAAGRVDGSTQNGATVANQKMWFDVGFRMEMDDISEAADNGRVTFFWRPVLPDVPLGPWTEHPTVLDNQCPNHTVALVPIIEFINGPTAGTDGVLGVEMWAFGRNRQCRR